MAEVQEPGECPIKAHYHQFSTAGAPVSRAFKGAPKIPGAFVAATSSLLRFPPNSLQHQKSSQVHAL